MSVPFHHSPSRRSTVIHPWAKSKLGNGREERSSTFISTPKNMYCFLSGIIAINYLIPLCTAKFSSHLIIAPLMPLFFPRIRALSLLLLTEIPSLEH